MRSSKAMNSAGILQNLCRACLGQPSPGDQLDVRLIYDEDERFTYIDCFKLLTNIDLGPATDGGEPHILCRECGMELQVAYDFHKKIKQSNRRIKQFLEGFQTQKAVETTNPMSDITSGQIAEMTQAPGDNVTADDIDSLISTVEEEYEGVGEFDDFVEEADGDDTVTDERTCEPELLNGKSDFFEVIALEPPDDIDEHHLNIIKECHDLDDQDSIQLDDVDLSQMIVNDESPERQDTDAVVVKNELVVEEQFEMIDATSAKAMLDDYAGVDLVDEDDCESPQQIVEAIETEAAAHFPLAVQVAAKEPRKRVSGPSICDVCNKVFPNRSKMNWHRRIHEENRMLYECPAPDCGKHYASKQSAMMHYKQDHLDQGSVCPICSKRFAIPQSLAVHMRYHTKDFPYVCNVCNKKFAQKGHLTTHMQVTHNNLRYVCCEEGCGKVFMNSMSLRNHRFLHTEMPFQCAFCERGFPQKSKLKSHISGKHNVELSLEDLEGMRKFKDPRTRHSFVSLDAIDTEKNTPG